MLEPYAIVTARNVIASMWRETRPTPAQPTSRRRPAASQTPPDEQMLLEEEQRPSWRPSPGCRSESARRWSRMKCPGRTPSLWRAESGSPPGRSPRSSTAAGPGCGWSTCLPWRSAEPPTERCRPVLFAISSGDRRRQREVDAARHLLGCELCARAESAPDGARPASERTRSGSPSTATRTSSRRGGRPARWRRGSASPRTELTMHRHGGLGGRPQHRPFRRRAVRSSSSCVDEPRPGLRVVARDSGSGIADVDQALRTATAPTTVWAWGYRGPGG